jgi:hypothetical protein
MTKETQNRIGTDSTARPEQLTIGDLAGPRYVKPPEHDMNTTGEPLGESYVPRPAMEEAITLGQIALFNPF